VRWPSGRVLADEAARPPLRVALPPDRLLISEVLSETSSIDSARSLRVASEPLQLARVGDLHTAEPDSPWGEGRITGPVLAQARDRNPCLMFLQDPDDLIPAEPALARPPFPVGI
jgi:hypothetical protein